MNRHEQFLETHREFVKFVQDYAQKHGLDYAIMIGNDCDIVLPWHITRTQNSEIMIKIIDEVQSKFEGTLHCEHQTSMDDFKKRMEQLRGDGYASIEDIKTHKPAVRH